MLAVAHCLGHRERVSMGDSPSSHCHLMQRWKPSQQENGPSPVTKLEGFPVVESRWEQADLPTRRLQNPWTADAETCAGSCHSCGGRDEGQREQMTRNRCHPAQHCRGQLGHRCLAQPCRRRLVLGHAVHERRAGCLLQPTRRQPRRQEVAEAPATWEEVASSRLAGATGAGVTPRGSNTHGHREQPLNATVQAAPPVPQLVALEQAAAPVGLCAQPSAVACWAAATGAADDLAATSVWAYSKPKRMLPMVTTPAVASSRTEGRAPRAPACCPPPQRCRQVTSVRWHACRVAAAPSKAPDERLPQAVAAACSPGESLAYQESEQNCSGALPVCWCHVPTLLVAMSAAVTCFRLEIATTPTALWLASPVRHRQAYWSRCVPPPHCWAERSMRQRLVQQRLAQKRPG